MYVSILDNSDRIFLPLPFGFSRLGLQFTNSHYVQIDYYVVRELFLSFSSEVTWLSHITLFIIHDDNLASISSVAVSLTRY